MPERDLVWWRERVARLRQGETGEGGAATADSTWWEIAEIALALGEQRVAPRFLPSLGTAAIDVVRDFVLGTTPLVRREGYRRGLRASLVEAENLPINPRAFVVACLVTACRSAIGQEKAADPYDDRREDTRLLSVRGEGAHSPTEEVAKVSLAFQDAMPLLAAALRIAPAVARDTLHSYFGDAIAKEGVLMGKATKWTKHWGALREHLRLHGELGRLRPRWRYFPAGERPGTLSVSDLQARAWQAVYYAFEEEPDYTEPGEVPVPGAPGRDLFDQHSKRFRDAYWLAYGVCGGLHEIAEDLSLARRLRLALDEEQSRLRGMLHYSRHETLTSGWVTTREERGS